MCVENDLIGKTIKTIEVDGYGLIITTTDGVVLDYCASDAGYSSWEVTRKNSEDVQEGTEK